MKWNNWTTYASIYIDKDNNLSEIVVFSRIQYKRTEIRTRTMNQGMAFVQTLIKNDRAKLNDTKITDTYIIYHFAITPRKQRMVKWGILPTINEIAKVSEKINITYEGGSLGMLNYSYNYIPGDSWFTIDENGNSIEHVTGVSPAQIQESLYQTIVTGKLRIRDKSNVLSYLWES